MDKKTYNRILEDCREFVKAGGELVQNSWEVTFNKWAGQWFPVDGEAPCGCALGAALVVESCDILAEVGTKAAGKLFGLKPKQVSDFIEGFDTDAYQYADHVYNEEMIAEVNKRASKSKFFAAGIKLRDQLIEEGLLNT